MHPAEPARRGAAIVLGSIALVHGPINFVRVVATLGTPTRRSPRRKSTLDFVHEPSRKIGEKETWRVAGYCLTGSTQSMRCSFARVLAATANQSSLPPCQESWAITRGSRSVDRRCTAGSTSAFQDFKTWCEEMNEQPGSQRRFSQKLLSRRGITLSKGRTGNSFVGIGLKADSPEAER